ncbi:MAG TPA: biotin/lipoyl-containing protein, partial [Gemmatimonadaceae bacterium]|nr:biotin/lipoyl-containing protein [Gemmatimonadaceae bacterium]
MPSLGADMERGTLVLWKVKPGDTVKRGDIVAEVETEKGVFEMEADGAGVVAELLVAPGTRTPVGAPLARLTGGRAIPAAAAAPAPAAPRASPAARRLAVGRGIELASLVGTGPDHAIVLADVERAVAALPGEARAPVPSAPVVVPPVPAIPAPAPAATDAARAMRQAVAAAVSRSKREIPHYYLSTDV